MRTVASAESAAAAGSSGEAGGSGGAHGQYSGGFARMNAGLATVAGGKRGGPAIGARAVAAAAGLGRYSLPGYWGDVIVGPWFAWGVEDLHRDGFEVRNKQVRAQLCLCRT